MRIDSHFLVIAMSCRANDGFFALARYVHPIKVSRPLARQSNLLGWTRAKASALISGENHAGKIWVSCSHNRCERSAFVSFRNGAACTGGVAPKSEMTHDQKDHNTRL